MYFFFSIHVGRSQLKFILYEKRQRDGPIITPYATPTSTENIVSRQGAAFKALIYIPTLGILLFNTNPVLSEFFRRTLETPRINSPSFSCYYPIIDKRRIKFRFIFFARKIQISLRIFYFILILLE